ncbi:hypothetical protein SGUI_2577 [Serinicoccus hydrothermalis]|uniref:Uncharacterized protein n=1 Tax=Serinicoccus hydrothermalis TaxID=1758689 RepID=A0A1B1NEY4_9MICO|nr:hypothetical protein [Serinicoccus hydrothermalis]ANS79973.1 hypothetical protein SGUI_2577 [Serinicoccus hydrothermalis]
MGDLLLLWLAGGGQLLVAGLLLGAGLPLVFALGIRALALADGGDAETGSPAPPRPWARPVAWLCFAAVVAGVLLGLAVIVSSGAGYELVLDGVLPTLQKEG